MADSKNLVKLGKKTHICEYIFSFGRTRLMRKGIWAENTDKMKKYLIVVAGGRGLRMGGELPKQFLKIGEKSVLHRTIERFVSACPDIRVVTVMNPDYIDFWKKYCLSSGMVVPQSIVRGGMTRFHSVRNALEKVPDDAVVAVHDGVRPFVSESLIRKMFDAAENFPALIPVLPCVDTMRALSVKRDALGDEVLEPLAVKLDRSILYSVQTPQIFHSDILKSAYSQPYDTSFTDDASAVERSGVPLSFIKGERLNIKLTTKEDLLLARAIFNSSK